MSPDMAIATARLSATTGDGWSRWSTPYSAVISAQSVRPEWRPRRAPLRSPPAIGTGPVSAAHRALNHRDAFGDLGVVPEPAVLLVQHDEFTGGAVACIPA